MEISFSLLRSKEIVNLYDGKRLGRAVDITFDKETAKVLGIILPGEKRMFKKSDDLFIPVELIKKLGEDVILVKLSPEEDERQTKAPIVHQEPNVYARYKRIPAKEE